MKKMLKEFAMGVIFLFALVILAGLGLLLLPLLFVAGLLLRVLIVFAFIFGAVWLLGKLVLYLFSKMK